MEFSKRKPTRLKEYNYSMPGAYFITICVKEKKKILSRIVEEGSTLVPKNIMTIYGKIADKYINEISNYYDNIDIEKYVIMPNHIHFILLIKEYKNGMSGASSPTNAVVSNFVSTFKRFCNKEYGENIWQRSYHDHIIRDEKDYRKIWEYIDTNVIKWNLDCFYY